MQWIKNYAGGSHDPLHNSRNDRHVNWFSPLIMLPHKTTPERAEFSPRALGEDQ